MSFTYGRLTIKAGDHVSMSTPPSPSQQLKARWYLADLALKLEQGRPLTEDERRTLARQLLRIASGEKADLVFGFNTSGRRSEADRDTQLLRDYCLRQERGERNVVSTVADMWFISEERVKSIRKGRHAAARQAVKDEIASLCREFDSSRESALRLIEKDVATHRARFITGEQIDYSAETTYTDTDGNEYVIPG